MAAPTIEWRNSVTPFATLSPLAFVGVGVSGAIPVGFSSSVITVRLYNNFANVGSIVDATNCVIACYDDTIHQGVATTTPTLNFYVQVKVLDYNGTATGADTVFFAIGGTTKHPIPVNSGTIAGSATNYVTLSFQIVIPAIATQGAITQGIWIEYTASA